MTGVEAGVVGAKRAGGAGAEAGGAGDDLEKAKLEIVLEILESLESLEYLASPSHIWISIEVGQHNGEIHAW